MCLGRIRALVTTRQGRFDGVVGEHTTGRQELRSKQRQLLLNVARLGSRPSHTAAEFNSESGLLSDFLVWYKIVKKYTTDSGFAFHGNEIAVKRCSALDAVARWHAETMAAEGKVRHSDSRDLQARLKDQVGEHLGENVGAGESIRAIHHEMMQNVGDSRNMTDRRYKEMGMATARGKNGELFLCQIFRG